MHVRMLRFTPEPEKLVCQAARNDYRTDGVAQYDFDEIMEAIDVDDEYASMTDTVRAKQFSLLKHLMKHGHWGPFEHPQATVELHGVTRALMAQITRHRHFTFDIMSMRYVEVEDIDEYSVPERFQLPIFRGADFDVDRHGVHELDDIDAIDETYTAAYLAASDYYQQLLASGVPQEQARKVLPMGTKVNIVVSGNARAWMHILNVRTKSNVQGETRRCAEAIFDVMKDWMPFTFSYYDENILPLTLNP